MDKETAKQIVIANLKEAIAILKYCKRLLKSDAEANQQRSIIEVSIKYISKTAGPIKSALDTLNQIDLTQFPPGGISTGRADEFIISPTGKPREFEIRTPTPEETSKWDEMVSKLDKAVTDHLAKNKADLIGNADITHIQNRAKLFELNKALVDAIREERFEDAAELRDKIEQIKGKQNEG